MGTLLGTGIRGLRRSPGFSLLAIAILTLGIGATTAMFSITRTVLLKPLAYRDPERLVTVTFRVPQFSKQFSTIPVNAQHYQLWRDHSRTIQELTLIRPDSHILSGPGPAEQMSGVRVSANFFHVLGVEPTLGRGFVAGEDEPGHNHAVVVSHAFWENKLGRRSVLGQKIFLDGEPYEVIGVMPASFPFPAAGQLSEVEQLPERTQYWVPLVFSKEDLETAVGNQNYLPIARLKPGVSTQQAVADLTALEKVIAKRYPEPVEFDPVVRPLQQAMAREVRFPLLILMAAVAAVLLIVCINLMNLMLVRATAQRREWAIRLALGAGVRHLLTAAFVESFLLSLSGAGLGSFLAVWLLEAVRLRAPVDLPRIDELVLDTPALLFGLGASVVSAFLFGLWPAWRATKADPQEALQSSSRTAGEGRKAHRTGKLLVAAEVALSTVLLLASGLLLRSFIAILGVEPGMKIQNVLTVRVNLPPDTYRTTNQIYSFYRRLTQQVSGIPGVHAAGLISDLPVTKENNNSPATAADHAIPPITQWPMTNYRYASTDYFQAAGIPVKDGRVFDERDGPAPEVVISANLAERLWPGQSAVGRPLKLYGNRNLLKVVGVVGSVHAASLTQGPTMMIYFADWQAISANMSLLVKTENEPASISSAVRGAVLRLEPQAAIPSIRTMREVVASSLSARRFQLILLAAFATMALVLASLGIYGVLAFATGRRTSEIGVRMAVGARPVEILRATLAGGMKPVVGGIVMGLAISVALARVLDSLLFQVRALDPLIYAATSLVLLIVSALACFIPARRAARLSPVEALRHQ